MINIAAAVFALAIFATAVLSLAGDAYWMEFSPGPAFMPLWIAGLGVVFAVLLIVQTLRRRNPDEDAPDFSNLRQASVVMALLCALVVAMPWLGMLIGTTGLILIVLIGLQQRAVVPSLVTAAISAGIVYGVFELWLNVDLPKGAFGL